MLLLVFLLALGLAMDAFAAAVAQGAATRPSPALALKIGAAFGLAQGLMPLIGWGLGAAFGDTLRAIDHWVALVLLGFLGARMIQSGLSPDDGSPTQLLTGRALLLTAIATSIDAAVAGITLPMLGAPVLLACAIIGVVTAALSTAGVYLGAALGQRFGKAAEIAGGAILVGLGLKIFVEHQFLGA
jgi:putative Mn2+ efflux pump MntP